MPLVAAVDPLYMDDLEKLEEDLKTYGLQQVIWEETTSVGDTPYIPQGLFCIVIL